MPDRNRLSTLNHYCQQDSQTTTQDTMTTQTQGGEAGPPGLPRLLVYHHHSAATWVASQATHSFFLCSSPKIHRLLVLKPKHRRISCRHQAYGLRGCYLGSSASALGSQAKMPLQLQFAGSRQRFCLVASQRQLHSFFSILDSQESSCFYYC
jgi:hypothetical protein